MGVAERLDVGPLSFQLTLRSRADISIALEMAVSLILNRNAETTRQHASFGVRIQ